METVDRQALAQIVEPILARHSFDLWERRALIAATAEAYAFPTSLDDNPPVGGLAPLTQWDSLMKRFG
ncbi:MAG: hypothetical protein AAF405_09030 [Pseudomonadota bacterium]